MHELSLVENLFTQLEQLLKENNAQKVLRVKVEIGAFSGVVLDSFQFAFTVLRENPLYSPWAESAKLEMSAPKPQYICECGHLQERGKLEPGICDICGSSFLTPAVGGKDIILQQVEME